MNGFTGRCYIPKSYLKDDEFKYLVDDRNPHRIPRAQLKRYAERMLEVADKMANEAMDLIIDLLPDQCLQAFVTKVKIYMGIGKLVRSNLFYERRVNVSKIEKIRIVLKYMYFTPLP